MGRVAGLLLAGIAALAAGWLLLDDAAAVPAAQPVRPLAAPGGPRAQASPRSVDPARGELTRAAGAPQPLRPPGPLAGSGEPPSPTWVPRVLPEALLAPADPHGPLLELSREILSCDGPPVRTLLVLHADGRVQRRVAVGDAPPELLDEHRLEGPGLLALLRAVNATGVLGGDVDLLAAAPPPDAPRRSDEPGRALTRLAAHLAQGTVRASGLDVAAEAALQGAPARLAALARAENLVWQAAR